MSHEAHTFDPGHIGFDVAFNSLPDPVFIYNHSRRRVERANPAAERVYGFSEEAFSKMAPWDIEAPYTEEGLGPLIDGLKAQGAAVYRTEHRDRWGRTFPAEVHAVYHLVNGQDYFVAVCRGLEERVEVELRAARAETRSHAIFKNARDSICVFRRSTGAIVDANPAFCALVGSQPAALVGQSAYGLAWDGEPLRKRLDRELPRLEAGETISERDGFRAGDGRLRWFDWQYQKFEEDMILAVGRDVTEELAASRAVEESERQLRRLLDLSPVAMLVADRSYNVLQMNRAFSRLFGYTMDDAPDIETWWRLAYPDPEYRRCAQARWRDAVDEAVSRGNWSVDPVEVTVTCKDGSQKVVDCSLGFAGELNLVVFTDLTASRNYEARIHEQAQHLDLHFRNTPLGVIEWDMDFKIRRWNPAAERIFGYTMEEAIGMSGLNLLLKGHRDGVLDVWRQLSRREGGHVNTNDNLRKDGSVVTCTWYNTPLVTEDGEVMGVASLVMDVTERRRYEENLKAAKEAAEQASRAKSEFLSVMSHELRTPLNSIVGPCQLLRAQLAPEASGGLLDIMLSSSGHLLNLINSILDLAKIESGGMEPKLQRIELAEFLGSRLEPLREIAFNKGLSFRVENRLPAGAFLESDPRLLLQIFFNLIGNATKFTSQGGIEVLAEPGEGLEEVRFCVADTGIGIADEDLGILFEPFRQLERGSGEVRSGTGLGLVITKELVHLLGGSIDVASEVGRGSRFTFTVSGLIPPAGPDGALRRSEPMRSAARSGPLEERILLVEDEPNNQFVCGAILKHLGVEYALADTGESAIELYRKSPFRIALLDIKLPGIDGVETAQRLRREAGDRPLYLIAQTAYALREQKERYLRDGLDDYVSKPLSIDELSAALERARLAVGR